MYIIFKNRYRLRNQYPVTKQDNYWWYAINKKIYVFENNCF